MSRYIVEQGHGREVVVGWDDPLGTFFAQVFEEATDELISSVGDSPRAITSLMSLAEWLESEHNIELPGDAAHCLSCDRAAHEDWKPGPLQAELGFSGVREPGGAVGPDGNVYSDAEGGL